MHLSKSDFLKYQICPSYFWLWKYKRELVPPDDQEEVAKQRLEQGNEIERYARTLFSNSQDANVQKWSAYISGDVKRQDYLETALDWISGGKIGAYMSEHRNDTDITELKQHFDTVINWASSVFTDVHSEMSSIEWNRLYNTYGSQKYDPSKVAEQVRELYTDYDVRRKKGIYEYILGGSQDTKLLEVRVFEPSTIKSAYAKQTKSAQEDGISNCPLCAVGDNVNKERIYKLHEMDADHVAAWSKGGATSAENCEMLCKTHNRAKGNR